MNIDMYICNNLKRMKMGKLLSYECPDCGDNRWRYHEADENGELKRVRCKNPVCRYEYNLSQLGTAKRYYKAKALQLYIEGIGSDTIARILDAPKQTIAYWIKRYGTGLEEVRLDKSMKGNPVPLNDEELYKIKDRFQRPRGIIIDGENIGESFIWGITRSISLPDS